MKSIERKFNLIQEKNPLWSSFVCFHQAILGKGFTRESINRNFSLIDKGDYARKDKVELVEFLFKSGKCS